MIDSTPAVRFLDIRQTAKLLIRSVTLLLVVCAAASAQSLDDPNALAAVRAACTEDAQKLCAGVQPGGGRIIACLKEHKDSLSDKCRKAVGLPANSNSNSTPSTPSTTPAPGNLGAATPTAPAAKPSPAAGTATKSSSTDAAVRGSYLRMKQVQVIANDPALGGNGELPAISMLIPSTWDFRGGVAANTKEGCFSDIFGVSWEAKSQDGSNTFQGAANDSWQYTDDPAALKRLTDPNRRARGAQGKPCPVKKPMKAEEYFRQEILKVFPGSSNVVSVEPFPQLNKIARMQLGLSPDDAGSSGDTRTEAIRARVKFQKDGKDMEDWVTVVVVTRVLRQGRGNFYDCHAIDIRAFMAPQGQLDANDKLFKVMLGSIRPEPKWQEFSGRYIAKLYQLEAQKEAAEDSMISAFQKYEADVINGVTENAMRGANNAAFGFDQNIRGVQTFRDPSTGRTMELSNLYDHAWLNGSNEYILSDDPNFNPNGVLNGDWNQLQVVRPAP